MIEQREIDKVNCHLTDHFGQQYDRPTWRVVWSEDQFEYRYGTYEDRTPEGFFIREVAERRKVPKYSQWIHEKWVLERLVVVPLDDVDHPTIDSALSYEPIYPFEEHLPPVWHAVKFIIENIYENMRQHDVEAKYRDPESTPKEAQNAKEERVKELEEALFGNETEAGDALAYKQGVGFTTSKELHPREN